MGHNWFRWWLVACSAPSQWNLNRKFIIFVQENTIENVFCQNDAHFVQGRCVKTAHQVSGNSSHVSHNTDRSSAIRLGLFSSLIVYTTSDKLCPASQTKSWLTNLLQVNNSRPALMRNSLKVFIKKPQQLETLQEIATSEIKMSSCCIS